MVVLNSYNKERRTNLLANPSTWTNSMLLTHPNVNIIVLFRKYYTYLYFVIDTVNHIDETTITYFIFQGRLHSILTVTDVLSIASIAINELIIFNSTITKLHWNCGSLSYAKIYHTSKYHTLKWGITVLCGCSCSVWLLEGFYDKQPVHFIVCFLSS